MNLAIYDDNPSDVQNLKDCIEQYFGYNNTNYNLTICKNSEELIVNINKFDIVFLDIELGNENGIEIGYKLRRNNFDTIIIITSKSKKYLIDGYKINAARYMLKPILFQDFEIELNTILHKFISYIVVDGKYKLKLNDIIYIEAQDRKTIIYLTKKKILKSSLTLSEWNEKLKGYTFSQPHRSYIVNCNHIKSIDKNELVLSSLNKVPLSRRYKQEFEERFYCNIHKLI